MTDAVCTLPDGLPQHTVGWDVLWWSARFIRRPDGPEAGGEWRFTPEQVRFLLWWYAVDEDGRWLYTRGLLRRSKGWGKTPLAAALALAELCGPVRFEAFASGGEERPWRPECYSAGEVIAQPSHAAWVQLAGVSEKQTTNTMSMVLGMCTESPMLEEYGLDLGLTRIYTASGGRLEPITASAPTAEGARPTAVFEDETQWYLESNGGAALDRVNRRNVGKSPGGTARVLETTNAHADGLSSVAERTYDAWLAGREQRTRGRARLLYDSREAPETVDLRDEESLLAGLAAAYGDATWVDLERIRDEVWDLSTPEEDSRRFYLNQIASAVNAWLDQPSWAGCADATAVVADRDAVVLGFDGSKGRKRGLADATALIGCRVSDGHLFEVGVWEQPLGIAGEGWQVPELEVDAALRDCFRRRNVVGVYADSSHWESFIASWEAEYAARLKVKASQQNPMRYAVTGTQAARQARALEQFRTAVVHRELTHDGSFKLTQHVLNARRVLRPSGEQIGKPEPSRKIDAAMAAVYAWQARTAAVAAGLGKQAAAVPRRIR